jgi:hypothetical protein
MDTLVNALESIWCERGLKRVCDWTAEGGRANVGCGSVSDQLVVMEDLDIKGFQAIAANA